MRVLLVEDDTSTAKTIEMMLKSEGYICDCTDLGEDGLEIGKIYDYDLIILDLMMAEMDGFEFLVELRKEETWRDIPVIVATAKTLTQEDYNRLNGQVERVLQKGAFSRERLLNDVREMVAKCARRQIKEEG